MPTEWRVLIADDEPAARRGVRQLLAAHDRFVVAGECRNGAETLRALDAARPDVLFLDIQMPGLDGFEVIRRRTPERMPLIVVLTAFERHALAAFDVDAVDYLLKPVSQSRFDAAMRRVRRRLDAASTSREPRLTVTTARGATLVPAREIEWIEAADNYVRLWTQGRSYLLREALDDLETRLRAHGFARAHRRALVRVGAVRRLTSTADGGLTAVLDSGATIDVSRRRRAAFAGAVRGA